MTKESAQSLCDSLELTSEFFDRDNEEYVLLKENNPKLLAAYEGLFTLAYGMDCNCPIGDASECQTCPNNIQQSTASIKFIPEEPIMTQARFELKEDENGRRFWWGAQEDWKDPTEVGENGQLIQIHVDAFEIGTIIEMREPIKGVDNE